MINFKFVSDYAKEILYLHRFTNSHFIYRHIQIHLALGNLILISLYKVIILIPTSSIPKKFY